MVFLLTEYLDMVLLPLVLLSALSVLVLLLEVLLEVLLDMVLLDMASVKLMLTLTLMLMLDMVMLAQLPHLLPSVTVSQSEPATRSLSAPPERLLRLCARKLLISRSSRIVLILSAPPAPSNLSSSLTPLLLLELTPGSDQKLLLQLTNRRCWSCCCSPCCWICWHRSRTCWICWILIVLNPQFLYFH